jgi:hypothetical protein
MLIYSDIKIESQKNAKRKIKMRVCVSRLIRLNFFKRCRQGSVYERNKTDIRPKQKKIDGLEN